MRKKINLKKYQSFIFDFDGVILQSNVIKTEVFSETLKKEPIKLLNKFIEYHKSNGGISRSTKFEHYFQNIKKVSDHKKVSKKFIKKYTSILSKKLYKAKLVPGLYYFIKNLFLYEKPIFIISGGSRNEIIKVLKQKKIYNNFDNIFGNTSTKFEHLRFLINKNKIIGPSIFFGDAEVDMKVAEKFNFDFCFVKKFSEWKDGESQIKKNSSFLINDFNDLLQ